MRTSKVPRATMRPSDRDDSFPSSSVVSDPVGGKSD